MPIEFAPPGPEIQPFNVGAPQQADPLQTLAQMGALRQQNLHAQAANLELQQARMEMNSNQAMLNAMAQGGTYEQIMQRMRSSGQVLPAAIYKVGQDYTNLQKEKLALETAQQADVAKKMDEYEALLVDEKGEPRVASPQDVNAVNLEAKRRGIFNFPGNVSFTPLDPSMVDPTHVKAYVSGLKAHSALMKERETGANIAAKEAEAAAAQAKTTETGQDIIGKERAQMAQAIQAAPQDQATGLPNPESWRSILATPTTDSSGKATTYQAKYNLPDQPTQQYIDTFLTSTVPTKDQPEYLLKLQAARALAHMSDADWVNYLDRVVPDRNTPLYQRTKAMVEFYRQQGKLKEADDAVKAAGEQLGATERAVATAKATVPFKVEVAGAAGAAAANAAEKSGAMDIMAEQALSGQFTSRNPQLLAAVYGRAAQLAKERGLTSQQVVMEQNAAKASRDAFTALTKQYETLKPFAEMAERNAKILEDKMAKVSNLGAPFLNTPLRDLQAKFGGNTDVAALRAAMMPVQADFARLLNSPTGAGALTDDSRHEMQKAIAEGATPGMVKAALDVFRTDARNRREEYEKSLADLKGRTVVSGQQAPSGGPTTYQRTATDPKTGHKLGWNPGDQFWTDTVTGKPVK